jgi:hypothetical protein
MSIKDKLLHAVTEWDRRASKRKGYNPFALGLMFEAVDRTSAAIEGGATVRVALVANFNDRLLDHCLKAVGEEVSV